MRIRFHIWPGDVTTVWLIWAGLGKVVLLSAVYLLGLAPKDEFSAYVLSVCLFWGLP